MLNNKKGIGLSIILKLVLGFMVLGLLISVSTVGSLGEAIFDSFNQINNKTDKTVEIDNERTLSQLTVLTRDRAMNHGCEIVERVNKGEVKDGIAGALGASVIQNYYESGEDSGYPGLKGTYLTKKPDCYGGDSGLIREGAGVVDPKDPDDNYMPGLYSRERFEIKKDIELNLGSGETWLEAEENAGLVHNINPTRHTNLIKEYEEAANKGAWLDRRSILIAAAASGIERQLELIPDSIMDAALIPGTPQNTNMANVQIYFTTPKEDIVQERVDGDPLDGFDKDNPESFNPGNSVTLCKGDEGYVQSSRGYPKNNGQSSKEPLYPIIVIEEVETKNC